jgi:uncharacterized membrane protein
MLVVEIGYFLFLLTAFCVYNAPASSAYFLISVIESFSVGNFLLYCTIFLKEKGITEGFLDWYQYVVLFCILMIVLCQVVLMFYQKYYSIKNFCYNWRKKRKLDRAKNRKIGGEMKKKEKWENDPKLVFMYPTGNLNNLKKEEERLDEILNESFEKSKNPKFLEESSNLRLGQLYNPKKRRVVLGKGKDRPFKIRSERMLQIPKKREKVSNLAFYPKTNKELEMNRDETKIKTQNQDFIKSLAKKREEQSGMGIGIFVGKMKKPKQKRGFLNMSMRSLRKPSSKEVSVKSSKSRRSGRTSRKSGKKGRSRFAKVEIDKEEMEEFREHRKESTENGNDVSILAGLDFSDLSG